MTQRLSTALARLDARALLEEIWAVLPQARLVGGSVRDMLCDQPVADLDLATPEPPETVMQRLCSGAIRVVPTGLQHGTVTAILGGRPFEITTLRRDVETDGRHAVVAWTNDWQEDAGRRDFTINAMSVDQKGRLHDYFDGAGDLAIGRVRFVGNAAGRIEEDALRILRFFRFHARYGRGDPDPDAIRAISAGVQMLRQLSAERIWSELRRLLQSRAPLDAVRLMQALGVLDVLLPGGGCPSRLEALLVLQAPADAVLRLAALANGPAGAIAKRLKLSNADAVRLASLHLGQRFDPTQDDDALRRLLVDEAVVPLVDRSWLMQSQDPTSPAAWERLRRRLAETPRPLLPLSGADALAAGLPAGPAIGEALRAVTDWWRAGGCVADHAACAARLRSITNTRR